MLRTRRWNISASKWILGCNTCSMWIASLSFLCWETDENSTRAEPFYSFLQSRFPKLLSTKCPNMESESPRPSLRPLLFVDWSKDLMNNHDARRARYANGLWMFTPYTKSSNNLIYFSGNQKGTSVIHFVQRITLSSFWFSNIYYFQKYSIIDLCNSVSVEFDQVILCIHSKKA